MTDFQSDADSSRGSERTFDPNRRSSTFQARITIFQQQIARRAGLAPGMLTAVEHPTAAALEAGLDDVRRAPADGGRVELIVRRPAENEREVVAVGALDRVEGLVGDAWRAQSDPPTADGWPDGDRQLTLMSARVARLVAVRADRWQLAGDQLFVDLDLSEANLPAATRLQVGTAVIEITVEPHLGCAKFAARFGRDALRFVNSVAGRELRLRGVNARVVVGGTVRTGDEIRKLHPGQGPGS
jgi:hypothetical protein